MESCKCPITQEIFQDPVIGEDGHTYERKAITDWLRKDGTSPITRQPMDINTLRTNHVVKQMIEELKNTSQSQQAQFQFQLDVDIRKTRQKPIFRGFGKAIHEVEWINRDGPPIILLKIGGAKANREASFYVQLSCHSHIVRTFGFVRYNPDSIMLLQECAPHGDLSDLFQENGFKPNERVLWKIFEQICDAMICLADNGIVHGDLACRNVLVFQYHATDPDKNLVKLTDFGLTKGSKLYSVADSPSMSTMTIIPIRYAAPEILCDPNKLNYSEKSDVYSMGVLMWEACSYGQLPYSSLDNDNDVRQRKLEDQRLTQPSSCSDELWNIINKCWHLEPQNRPDFRSLKQSLLKIEFQSVSKSEKQSQKEKNLESKFEIVSELNKPPVSSQKTTKEFQTDTTTQQYSLPAYNNDNLPILETISSATYIPDYKQRCITRTNFEQHEGNNCDNRELQCSFCQESQPSSRQLSEHLVQCGNKTDQCTNCQKFIRRAIFAYHYENGCANLDEPDNPTPPTRISSAHRPSSNISKPVSKNNDFIDDDQENNSASTSINDHLAKLQQISSATSKNKSPTDVKECRYCKHRCLRSDYNAHKTNCFRNPENLNKDQQRTSFIPEKPESRPSTSEGHRSNDIVQIPCEFCNESIDLNLWSTHIEDCQIEARARTISKIPITEHFPCEHCQELYSVDQLHTHERACERNPEKRGRLARPAGTQPRTTPSLFNGLTNTQRDPTLSSTNSSVPSSYTSRTQDILDRIRGRENDATLRNKHSSSHVTTNTKPTLERSRLHDRGSLMATSSKANKPLLDPNNILFGSSHDEDLEHQPIINNERGHLASDKPKSKSISS